MKSRRWHLRTHSRGILLILELPHFVSVGIIINWTLVYVSKNNLKYFDFKMQSEYDFYYKSESIWEPDALIQRVGGNYVYHPLLSWSAKCCPFKCLPRTDSKWGWYIFKPCFSLLFQQNAAFVFFSTSTFLFEAWLLITKTTKTHAQCKYPEAFRYWFWFKKYII